MHVVLTVLECKRKMTEQYLPTNINGPRLPRRDVVGDIQLNLDDEFIVITAGNPNITLPNATVIPSRQIYIKSETGTGTVLALPGQLIDGAPSFSFGIASESRLFKSDGINWKLVGGLVGSGFELGRWWWGIDDGRCHRSVRHRWCFPGKGDLDDMGRLQFAGAHSAGEGR